MSEDDMSAIRNRFKGALVGALIGDCLGAYWETQSWIGTHPIEMVKEKIGEQIRQTTSKRAPVISYTDDSALTFATAESLAECKQFDAQHMVRRLTGEYFSDPRRGYGSSIGTVFVKLKKSNFMNIYKPATEQFMGEGSFGNGAAMRMSPAALLGYRDDQKLIEVCRESAKLTHFHISGINGALLQAMAVKLALLAAGSLDPLAFVDSLLQQIHPFETEYLPPPGTPGEQTENGQMDTASLPMPLGIRVHLINGRPSYTSKLEQIRALLTQEEPPSASAAQSILGHGVSAAEAVPCAIYAFLRSSGDSFRELIPYSISLGGDTDTIASMAGAIGGAYWGMEEIPKEWIDCCEASSEAQSLADKLYDIVMA